jgi:hypothetical protein
VGSASIAGWIAQVTFIVLLVVGWEDLGVKRRVIFVALWLAGWKGLRYFPYGELLFSPYVALLDIVLVLLIFKGDLPLH